MKRRIIFLSTLFLVIIMMFGNTITAQESSKTEKELQQTVDLQKKAIDAQKQSQDIQLRQVQKLNLDSLRNFGNINDAMRIYRSRARNSGNMNEGPNDSFIYGPGAPFEGYFPSSNDAERTTWDYSKHVKETTFARDYTFDVEKSANTVVMSIIGDCKTGQINVKIIMPNGKLFSDIIIDESGNLNWRKSFTISEQENKDKAGEWKFKIESQKATGYFKISLQTY